LAVLFSAANQAVSALAFDIVRGSLTELGVVAQGENPNAEDSAWGLEKLQRTIDRANAEREFVFAVNFLQFTTRANGGTGPNGAHTIGPGGDFNLPTRPVKIASGNFILNPGTSNPIYAPPIRMMDKDWWANLPTPQLVSTIITHCYYESTNPLGALNFWPQINYANPVRLEIWNSLQQAISLNTGLALPQAYWDWLIYEVAMALLPSYPAAETSAAALRENWLRTVNVIEENNYEPPKIDTDAGMPNSRKGGRPDFNFLTGLRE
jgi:hypothetical protein